MINDRILKQKKHDEECENEVILYGIGCKDTDLYEDEINAATSALKKVLEDFDSKFIKNVDRFHAMDDKGFYPMKVTINRLSVAKELVEVAEEAKYDWFSRSRPKNVRIHNADVKRQVDDLNLKLPVNSPTLWEALQVGSMHIVRKVENPDYIAPAHPQVEATEGQNQNQRPTNAKKRRLQSS